MGKRVKKHPAQAFTHIPQSCNDLLIDVLGSGSVSVVLSDRYVVEYHGGAKNYVVEVKTRLYCLSYWRITGEIEPASEEEEDHYPAIKAALEAWEESQTRMRTLEELYAVRTAARIEARRFGGDGRWALTLDEVWRILANDRNLRGATLTGIDLSYVNLSDVDLTGADLTGATLEYARLGGANLTDAIGVVISGEVGSVGRIAYAIDHIDRIYILAGCFWGTIRRMRVDMDEKPSPHYHVGGVWREQYEAFFAHAEAVFAEQRKARGFK